MGTKLDIKNSTGDIVKSVVMRQFLSMSKERQHELEHLYKDRFMFINKLKLTDEYDDNNLYRLGRELELIEYCIQSQLNETHQRLLHKFWELPKCKCPNEDNNKILDLFGESRNNVAAAVVVINPYCKVHTKPFLLFSVFYDDTTPKNFSDLILDKYVQLNKSDINSKNELIDEYLVLKRFNLDYNGKIQRYDEDDIFSYNRTFYKNKP